MSYNKEAYEWIENNNDEGPSSIWSQGYQAAVENLEVYLNYNRPKEEEKKVEQYHVSDYDHLVIVMCGNSYAVRFDTTFVPDAKERAEALAAELNEANKPLYTVYRADEYTFHVEDTQTEELVASFYNALNSDEAHRNADAWAKRLNEWS